MPHRNTCLGRRTKNRGQKQGNKKPGDKKNGPRLRGPSCLGSLALRELFWRPNGGVAVGAGAEPRGGGWALCFGCVVAAGGGGAWGVGVVRYVTAALCQLRQERFGVTLLPGPPNCFPSRSRAHC